MIMRVNRSYSAAFFINERACDEYPECADNCACILCACVRENVCRLPVYHADDHGADHHVNERDCGAILHVYGYGNVLLL